MITKVSYVLFGNGSICTKTLLHKGSNTHKDTFVQNFKKQNKIERKKENK